MVTGSGVSHCWQNSCSVATNSFSGSGWQLIVTLSESGTRCCQLCEFTSWETSHNISGRGTNHKPIPLKLFDFALWSSLEWQSQEKLSGFCYFLYDYFL